MSDGWICDACGETLLADSDVRYILDIRGFAAYDPMEVSPSDMEIDFDAEIRRLLSQMESADPRSLEDDVHKEFRLDLCPACWRLFRRDPLAGFREHVASERGASERGASERGSRDDRSASDGGVVPETE